jgi:hypothetical protein
MLWYMRSSRTSSPGISFRDLSDNLPEPHLRNIYMSPRPKAMVKAA